jgi:hypothetical protein
MLRVVAYAVRVRAFPVDRVLRPERAALSAARDLVAEHDDPRSAWSALLECGLLPEGWRHDTRRLFPDLGDRTRWERSQAFRRAHHAPTSRHPDDRTVCAVFAADVEGIERAEASGRAFFAALAPWGVPAPTTVLWVPTCLEHYDYQLHDTKPDVWEPDAMVFRPFHRRIWHSPDVTWEEMRDALERLRRSASASWGGAATKVAQVVGPYLYAEERWARAARERRRTEQGVLYAELPNPFSSALEVFEAGYALMPSSADKLVLGYPLDDADPAFLALPRPARDA